MFGSSPPPATSDMSGVQALLELITNPEAFKKRMQELTDQIAAVQKAKDQLEADTEKAKAEVVEARRKFNTDVAAERFKIDGAATKVAVRDAAVGKREAALASAEQALDGAKAKVQEIADARQKSLDAREAKIVSDRAILEEHDASLASKEHALKVREETIARREQKLSELEETATAIAASNEKLRVVLSDKLTRLKDIMA